MENKNFRDKISFEGTGKVLIQYHKYTENFAKDIIKKVKSIGGDVNVKDLLLQKGIINEAGDMIKIAPKRVVIKDGTDYFDEKLIQNADFVFLKGGQLEEKLNAKSITVAKDRAKHVQLEAKSITFINGKSENEILKTTDLYVQGTKISNAKNINATNVTLKKDASVDGLTSDYIKANDNSTVINSKAKGDIEANGKSKVTNSTADDINAYDNSKVQDSTAGSYIYANDNSTLSGINNGKYAIFLKGLTTVDGTLKGEIRYVDKTVTFTPKAKLDETARKTLPVRNFRTLWLKYNPNKLAI